MLYCFDVDGTLIRSFMREGGEAEDYDRVELLPWRLLRLCALPRDSRFAIITNQAGVAMGYQTPDQVRAKMGAVLAACEFFHRRPVSVHIAMHHPKPKLPAWVTPPGDNRRKPGPGMLWEAMEVHGIDFMPVEGISPGAREACFVGDMESDEECARRAGITYHDARDFFGERAT